MAMVPRVVLAGVVASAAATTLHFQPASAADECLSKPKGSAPAGQHWYYRLDRPTKRQCWYLDKVAAHGASLSERKSASAAHQHRELSQTAADAHAEFDSPPTPATDVKRDVAAATPATVTPPANFAAAAPVAMRAPAADNTPVMARAQDEVVAAADQSSVASRWPDAAGAPQPVAAPAPQQVAAPSPDPATLTTAAADPAPVESVDSSTTAAAADASEADSGSLSMTAVASTVDSSRTRLAVFLGAVALAGFSISVLIARARARRRIRLEPTGARRRPLWPADPEIDQMQLPNEDRDIPELAMRSEPAPRRAARLSIVPRGEVYYDDQYEIENLLARYGGQGRSSR
jgi:hypothetical protein